MSGTTDYGKFYPPGYNNADPPKVPQFALSANGTAFAASIQQAGGEVTVDSFGGINMAANSGSFIGIDSFANITMSAFSTGTVLIESAGSGAEVEIVNAGSIRFDPFGQGALYNVQTINGTVYPPTGSGATTSITQADALVACLGNGSIVISSIGAGADVEVYNAGTIRFDTAGAGAIENLSTINGSAYVPFSGSLSSITNGGGFVDVQSDGGIFAAVSGSAYLAMQSATGVVPNRVVLTSGDNAPAITMGASGGNDIEINNLFATVPSYITMLAGGEVNIQGASVTIQGVPYPPVIPPPYIPSNLEVSTLTAADYVSTLVLEGVSTISGNDIIMNANTLNLYGASATLGDGFGAGFNFSGTQSRVIGFNGLIIDANLSVSTITDISSINGSEYPPLLTPDPLFSTITMNDSGKINTNNLVNPATNAGDFTITQENPTRGLYLNLGSPQLGQIGLDQTGTALINYNLDGGITVNPAGNTLEFLQTSGFITQGQIVGLSTVNGIPYGASTSVGASYVLTGTTMGAVITTYPTGNTNPLPSNTFTNVSQITFNIPPNWTATENVFYDGWVLYDFSANFNSFWGVNYYTNTVPTPVDILGSTTTPANALNYSNIQQIYLPLNLIIPPTNLTAGGTITLTMYCNPTSNNHYLTIPPVINARVGVALD